MSHIPTPLNRLAGQIHMTAVQHGFWEGNRTLAEQVVLMHCELSEAIEEERAGRTDIWYGEGGKPEGVATELVDCMIRILDTLAARDIDIDALVAEKCDYNGTRPYKHGKRY